MTSFGVESDACLSVLAWKPQVVIKPLPPIDDRSNGTLHIGSRRKYGWRRAKRFGCGVSGRNWEL